MSDQNGQNAVAIEITLHELEELLGLPAGHHITAAAYDYDREHIRLKVEHPSFPEAEPKAKLPTARLVREVRIEI